MLVCKETKTNPNENSIKSFSIENQSTWDCWAPVVVVVAFLIGQDKISTVVLWHID